MALPDHSEILAQSRRGFDGLLEINGIQYAFVQEFELPAHETGVLTAGAPAEEIDAAIPGKRKRGIIKIKTLVPQSGSEKQWDIWFKAASKGIPGTFKFFVNFHRTNALGVITETYDYGLCWVSKIQPSAYKKSEDSEELEMKDLEIQPGRIEKLL